MPGSCPQGVENAFGRIDQAAPWTTGCGINDPAVRTCYRDSHSAPSQAAKMNVTQPSISYQIKNLEKHLNA